MSTIKLTPHAYPQNVQATADILKRGEWYLWDCPEADNYMRPPIPNEKHPHCAQWHEWQELVKSGAVHRGEAWMEWLHLGEWKNAATLPHHKPEGCMWRADTDYRIVRKEPKLKLIDWRRMPEGVMTNIGEILATYLEGVQVTILEIDQFILQFRRFEELRLAPADQQPWLLWMGGECPVPEGVIVEYCFRNNYKGKDLWKCLFWSHTTCDGDIIAYRINGLAPGWTDDPNKAK